MRGRRSAGHEQVCPRSPGRSSPLAQCRFCTTMSRSFQSMLLSTVQCVCSGLQCKCSGPGRSSPLARCKSGSLTSRRASRELAKSCGSSEFSPAPAPTPPLIYYNIVYSIQVFAQAYTVVYAGPRSIQLNMPAPRPRAEPRAGDRQRDDQASRSGLALSRPQGSARGG